VGGRNRFICMINAVVTTGIYCRPECPGRPLARNVVHFDTPEEAAAAGFRACLRCRPDGEAIRHGVVDSAVGPLLVAATERGVRAVAIGASPARFARDLEARHPDDWVVRDQEAVEPLALRVAALIEGRADDVPLDIGGTDFQRRVWDALRAIPRGETRSYGSLAAELGHPGAARAVGHACATNPAAIVVPCHRAVGASGSLNGFAWGLERKRALLDLEAA
jgi:AraC family transcriptional regulator, regulatory protein of adaptative response / methylated-DNA-[protein]-cysteine methyltransferase